MSLRAQYALVLALNVCLLIAIFVLPPGPRIAAASLILVCLVLVIVEQWRALMRW